MVRSWLSFPFLREIMRTYHKQVWASLALPCMIKIRDISDFIFFVYYTIHSFSLIWRIAFSKMRVNSLSDSDKPF